MLTHAKFGNASSTVVVEEFLDGIELSVFVLTDGKNYKILPTCTITVFEKRAVNWLASATIFLTLFVALVLLVTQTSVLVIWIFVLINGY